MSKIADVVPKKKAVLKDIKLSLLHYQFIPIVTPIKLWNYDMSLAHSPHVELMTILLEHGFCWPKIAGTRYVTERIRRHDLGLSQWTESKIKEHIKRRFAILRSLQRAGYRDKLHGKKPVAVLRHPFWKSRFGYDRDWFKGMEIWDGGGRCAAAMALGWETIPAMMYEDVKPGSRDKGKFKTKLAQVNGVWDETFGEYHHSVL